MDWRIQRNRDGSYSSTSYNAENRSVTAYSVAADFFQGYTEDPDAAPQYDEYGYGLSETQLVQQQLFGGVGGFHFGSATSASTHLKSYLYANNKPIAQAQGTQSISLKKLSLTGATPQYDSPQPGGGLPGFPPTGPIIGYKLTLSADDLVTGSGGQIDRAATARRIAALHYDGFSTLSAAPRPRSWPTSRDSCRPLWPWAPN